VGRTCSTHVGDIKCWSQNLKGRGHLKYPGVAGRKILKLILEKYMWRCGLDSSDSGQGPIEGSCEHDNDISDNINAGIFFTTE